MKRIEWRKFRSRSEDGRTFRTRVMLPNGSGELLLAQITQMPKADRRAIGYDEACAQFLDAFHKFVLEDPTTAKDVESFQNRFVDWISDQGFYIELKGEGYEYSYTDEPELTPEMMRERASRLRLDAPAELLEFSLALWAFMREDGPQQAEEVAERIPFGEFQIFWLRLMSEIPTHQMAIESIQHAELRAEKGEISKGEAVALRFLPALVNAISQGFYPEEVFQDGSNLRLVA
jgi:hypothetical protein